MYLSNSKVCIGFFSEHAVPKGGLEDMEFCYGSRSQLGLVLDWILDFHAKYRDKKTFAAMSFDHVIGKD